MLKNTLTVLRGTVAAQALGFLALPLLTRLFTPESFGQFQLYQSALTLLLVVAAMRFEIALLRAHDGPEVSAVLKLCAIINVVVACVVALVSYAAWIIPGAVSDSTRQILWCLPLGVLVGGGLQTLGYLALREKAFGPTSTAKVAQAGGYVGAGLGIGIVAPISSGLIVADLVGRAVSVITLCLHRSIFNSIRLKQATKQDLSNVIRKFREFPLVSVPGGLINSAGGTMTAFLMYGAFDATVSGHYGLVERSLMLPVGMITVAVSQVFTADLSASLRDGGSRALSIFRRTAAQMFALSILPACFVGVFAPAIFDLIFGAHWALAGEFARVMAPLLVVSLVVGSVNMAVMILGWQKVQLAWEMARLAAISAAWLCVVHFKLTPQVAIATHVTINILMNLLYLWLADCMIRRYATRRSSL
jgi:teichuronic acid exporter